MRTRAVDRMLGGEETRPVEDARKRALGTADMQDDEEGGAEIAGERRNQGRERLHAAGRRSDHDDVADAGCACDFPARHERRLAGSAGPLRRRDRESMQLRYAAGTERQ